MDSVEFILVSDREIARLNARFLGKRRPTDVIAFDYNTGCPALAGGITPAKAGHPVFKMPAGEVYISIDTARRQAGQRGVRLKEELLRLAVHGAVHLEGYDDTSLAALCRMREREWEILIQCVSVEVFKCLSLKSF